MFKVVIKKKTLIRIFFHLRTIGILAFLIVCGKSLHQEDWSTTQSTNA